jgi:hypothetical protein
MAGMTSDEADKLQKEWGNKPCDHPDLIAEREIGDEKWRCIQCGGLVDFDQWQKSHGDRPQAGPARRMRSTPHENLVLALDEIDQLVAKMQELANGHETGVAQHIASLLQEIQATIEIAEVALRLGAIVS